MVQVRIIGDIWCCSLRGHLTCAVAKLEGQKICNPNPRYSHLKDEEAVQNSHQKRLSYFITEWNFFNDVTNLFD